MDSIVSFGDWVRSRRKSLDLTQDQLGSLVGCSVSAIRKIESDQRRPSRQISDILANVLQIAPEQKEDFIRSARGDWRAFALGSFSAAQTGTVQKWSSLPIPPGELIGRSIELEHLLELLRDERRRLVTIVGLGGIGKTRLAVEAAHGAMDWFERGAVYVSAVAVHSDDSLTTALGQTLGLTFRGSSPVQDQLAQALTGLNLLLLIDNYEPLRLSGSLLKKIISRAAGVKVLITSSEPVGLLDEWVVQLNRLPVLEAYSPGYEQISSVRLFELEARRVNDRFTLEEQDPAAVIRICQLAEGNPLAIQLAAGWTRMLSCREIAAEMEKSFDFLMTSSKTVPERQSSVRAVYEHSVSLLNPEEKRVLEQLAVFQGGFRLQAAQRVTQASLPVLAHLVDRSLIFRRENQRFEMHELVRQYGLERLKLDPEAYQAARSRHSRLYARWMASTVNALESEQRGRLLLDMAEEIGNIRLAWDWALAQRDYENIEGVIPGLSVLYESQGWYQEGAYVFGEAVKQFCARVPEECGTEEPEKQSAHTITQARLRAHHALFLAHTGDTFRAAEEIQAARRLLSQLPGNWAAPDLERIFSQPGVVDRNNLPG